MGLWNNIKKTIPAVLIGGYTLFGLNSDNKTIVETKKEPKNLTVKKIKVKNPVLRVSYQTDTLQKISSILLFNQNNRIHRNYKSKESLYKMRMYLFVHEVWHSHNNNLGMRIKIFSPQEYRKICMHDEISANLCSLNALILEYKLSDDKKAFLEQFSKPNGYFSFYFDEVKKGNIDPFSNDSAMIEKSRKLQINGMIKTWMARSYKSYVKRQQNHLFSYLKKKGIHNGHKRNYDRLLHGMYTIGGVDFWKYVDEDIKTDDISLINSFGKIKSLPDKGKKITDEIRNNLPLIEKINDASQRHKALQHLIIAAELKTEIKNNNYELNEKVATILYNKIKTKYSLDNSFAKFAEEACLLSQKAPYVDNNYSLDTFIESVYTFKGQNLSAFINNFSPDDVPHKQYSALQNYIYDSNETFVNFINGGVIQDMILDTQISKEKPSENKAEKTAEKTTSHSSALQYLNIPNFEEPILLDNSAEVREKLKQIYNDFLLLPEVREFSDEKAPSQRLQTLRSRQSHEKKGALVSLKQFYLPNRARYNR